MEQEQTGFHPRQLTPGTRVINIPSQAEYVLDKRWQHDDGWHFVGVDGQLSGPGGVGDRVWLSTDVWAVVDDTIDADEEIASIGIDFDSLETEDIEAMATLMHESNEARVAELEAAAGPGQAGSLENAFDALKMVVFLEQIALHLGITDRCVLDFEGRRANMLTAIENKYQEMLKARDAAERQARMSGGPIGNRGGVRMAPGPGGKLRPIQGPTPA